MKKFFYMNSFFTKIILAILSFSVIICIFIPYMRIPAVATVQDIDVDNNVLTRKIGFEQAKFEITEFTHTSMKVIELYKDRELTEVVNKAEIPLYANTSVYYLATYAFGYDAKDKDAGPQTILLDLYELKLTLGEKNTTPVSIKTTIEQTPVDGLSGVIDVTVPKTKVFDLANIIEEKKAWRELDDNQIVGSFTSKTELPEPKGVDVQANEKNVKHTIYKWVAITLRLNGAGEMADTTYYPLAYYDLQIERDEYKKTLPVVGEIGGSLMPTEQTSKGIGFYEKDAFMFAFMIIAAISTILALTVPNSLRIVESILAAIMGIALIIIPISDISFYSKYRFEFDPGCFILIILGVLLLLWSVFDYIRCTREYKSEKARLYGADFFSPERKIRMKEERRIKDIEYKERKKEEKAQLKLAAEEEAAKLKAYKEEKKKNK